MVLGFSVHGFFAEVRMQMPSAFSGQLYTFETKDDDAVSVHVEGTLCHSFGIASRARCTSTGEEYDLRRLRLSAKSGALVTLEALEALERQSALAASAGSHLHIAKCHATIVENIGVEHCRLLLCAPCCMDLATHLRAHGNTLLTESVAELGEQLSLGLRHLHSLDVLCGSLTTKSILFGCDGKWKLLGDLRLAAALPVSMDEWRRRWLLLSSEEQPLLPPEVHSNCAENEERAMVAFVQDIWMLGALLSNVLQGVDCRCIEGVRTGNAVLAASQDVLLCPYTARFWIMLHWLLAKEPSQRPSSRRLVDIMHSLVEFSPCDLLIEIPEYARFHCQSMATAAARNLAYASMAMTGTNISCVAGLPLEVLRMSLLDSSAVDQLCENCGLDLGDFPNLDTADIPIPSLVPMLLVPAPESRKSVECMNIEKENQLRSRSSSASCLDADESTDEGNSSSDESNESCRSSLHRPCHSSNPLA
jgi:hypothetical protein